MINTFISITSWLINNLNRSLSWLESKNRSTGRQSKYVDLAPTDEADKEGVYSETILFAINNAKVSNIALTGPYGSGKSSIIQSFLKKYGRPVLHISLAAFAPEADSEERKVSRQEIERSILQQMLYGADANKLPLSRFKRIKSPSFLSIFKSLYLMVGILSLCYIFHYREKVISGSFFTPLELANWFNLGSFIFATVFLWVILHHIYVASFGFSLKSISLKNVEIKPAHDDQASILNRHLDEIVYFFQSTKYDLVIIEDLDRFNSPEIFVTLREINSLVNENASVKRPIRFLYALRDDMFVSTDRTKFFEFIIPVIPIINSSNSIDMVLKQGRRIEIDGRLNRQFLREVSRYLNDLRLIQNIFNEYAIYVANLESDEEELFDANKLLAILIYKNVYPRDFELLHRGTGTFSKILNRKEELIGHFEATNRAEIIQLEKQLEIAERQTPSDLSELKKIYAMTLIEKLPQHTSLISDDRQTWIPLPNLPGHDKFEKLIEAPQLMPQFQRGTGSWVDVTGVQRDVDHAKSYKQRKVEIERKAADNKTNISRRISELRSNIATVRATQLNELLRLNDDSEKELFDDFGKNGELARFLILEGYLDDSYYQYTSLFHSGRLSPNDNKFLIQIRAFITPQPGFPIDNPKEVIAAMRDEDFRRSYVLNVTLVDCLLSDRSQFLEQNQKLCEFLSSEFESSEDFFNAYYTSGRDVARLLSGLATAWKGLVPAAIASPNNISHVTQLLSNVPESLLQSLTRDFEELGRFISENLPDVLVNSPELTPERLSCIDFEVKELEAIKEHYEIVHFMFEKGLFELTIGNLEYIYQVILGENDVESFREKNFSTIRMTNNATLMKRVEREFDCYFHNIILELQDNSKEDAEAILAVIQHDTLNKDEIITFLERQSTQLPTLEKVPGKLHTTLFNLNLIEPTWTNCLDFMNSEGFAAESLAGYLERDAVRDEILVNPIPSDSESFKLREFLINLDSLSDTSYIKYVYALPKKFKNFPKQLELNKLRILIEKGKITFTKESLDDIADDRDLQISFLAVNMSNYLAEPDKFELDEDFREDLLRTKIDKSDKLDLIELMDLGDISNFPERAKLIGQIINETDANISNIDVSIAQSLIIHSTPIDTQVSLFNKYQSLMTIDEVRYVLTSLPKPYSEISTGYSTPRLRNTRENKSLVRWLDSKNVISSWSEGTFLSDDIRVNLYRR